MKTTVFAIAALGFAAPGLGQTLATQLTVQQQFDAGDAAIAAKDWATAAAIYTALEARLATGKSERSKAIVALRKGLAQSYADRSLQSETAITAALARMPTTDASLASDRWRGWLRLGDLAARRYDYPAAHLSFREALASAPAPAEKIVSYEGLISVGMFIDRQRALADADAMLALLGAQPSVNQEWLGLAQMLRGRSLLNLGRAAEARDVSMLAIKLLGGLSYKKVSLLDSAARSDAAVAAIFAGDGDAARRVLSFTGAAMQSHQGFLLPAQAEPPACGGANGPQPDDVAVVELGIGEDGAVSTARPVYFSGKPQAAAEFGKAVAGWSWSAEELAKVLPFFRAQTRIELRCTNVFNRPGVASMLFPQAQEWLASKAAPVGPLPDNPAAELAALRAELTNREKQHGKDSVQLMPVTNRLAANSALPRADRAVQARVTAQLARKNGAPPLALAFFILEANAAYGADDRELISGLRSAMVDPSLTQDHATRAAISVALFDSLPGSERNTAGKILLARVAGDEALPANDPFRVGALIRLANLEANAGALGAARDYFDQTGLSGQQCALVDAKPRQTTGSIRDKDYPKEALRWGFGGWAVVEFDIAADGRSQKVRSLVTFPPFVFGDPTAKQVSQFTYEQSYRPDGGPGCVANRVRVLYRSAQ